MLVKPNGQLFDVNLVQMLTVERTEKRSWKNSMLILAQKQMKNSDINIVMRDCNSVGLDIRNYRETSFVEFCQENNLVITNKLFKLRKRRLYLSISK